MSRTVVASVLGLAAVVATAWGARVLDGRRAMLDSDAALQRGDAMEAILAARIAAESRCPMCTAEARGYERLEGIAKDAEVRGEAAVAFSAFRAMRAAALATGGTDARRRRADAEIARIGHALDAARTTGGAPTAAASESALRDALAMDDTPRSTTFALLAAGAIAFFAGALRFVRAREGSRWPDVLVAAAGIAIATLGLVYF